jgi:chloramphenicol 3-O phosphotransferase
MRAAVVALLAAGNKVILDEMPVDETVMPAWRAALAEYDVFWVALQAPLPVLEAREELRDHGRHLGNARGHYGFGMDGQFDLVLDSSALSPDQRAAAIVEALNGAFG